MDPRLEQLDELHIRPLMDLIEGMRARGLRVPNVDPSDGGIHARLLVLLESPGPKAVVSDFVSRDNPDPSARNVGFVLKQAGLARKDVLIWNIVPYCVSTADKNRNATAADIRAAIADTQAWIDALPSLAVVVFCGRKAQQAIPHLHLSSRVHVFATFHTGAMAFNRPAYREHILQTFRAAADVICPRRDAEQIAL